MMASDLFSAVYVLERRRDEILESFAISGNKDELTAELGEIEARLQQDYTFLDAKADAMREARFGCAL